MCYAAPGPRCSPHAREKLVKKKEAFAQLATEPTKAFEAYHEMREAEEAFFRTPAGFAALENQIATTAGQKQYDAEELLAKAKTERAASLAAIQKVDPNVILEEEDAEFLSDKVESEESLLAESRLEALTSVHHNTVLNPHFEEVRAIVKKHPHLYEAAVGNDSTLRSKEKFELAVDRGDVVGIGTHMSSSDAQENPELLLSTVQTLRTQLEVGPNPKFERAYQQATYLMAGAADTEEKMDEFLDNYPHQSVNPSAQDRITWNGNLTPRQATRFVKDVLEKGSSMQDYRSVRAVLARSDGNHPEMFRDTDDAPTGFVPLDINSKDIRIVNTPYLTLSKDPEQRGKVALAQARIDATEEGGAILREYVKSANLDADPSRIHRYEQRLNRAAEYQQAWWQVRKAVDTYGS